MSGLFLPKLDKTMPLVTGTITVNGKSVEFQAIATPQFQRFWQTQAVKLDGTTGLSFASETAAASYDQAQMQRVINFCAAVSAAFA